MDHSVCIVFVAVVPISENPFLTLAPASALARLPVAERRISIFLVAVAGGVRLAPVAPGAREPVRAEAGGAAVGGSAHAGAAVQAAQGGAGR